MTNLQYPIKKPDGLATAGSVVHLRDKISNTLLQEIEALSALYQVVMEDVKSSKG
jgi:hypothetical protein